MSAGFRAGALAEDGLIRQDIVDRLAHGDRWAASEAAWELHNPGITGHREDNRELRLLRRVTFIPPHNCWFWVGPRDPAGYGLVPRDWEKTTRAHRAAWRVYRGNPGRLKVLHKCDVRSCINPEHLFLGTQADNVRDMIEKGRARMGVPQPGESNPMSKLTIGAVLDIRQRHADGESQRALAREYGVGVMTVNRAIRRESWSHV